MKQLFANYQEEREAFRSLLSVECRKKILLFRGESGTGKTALIMACQGEICDSFLSLPIQLRGYTVDVAEFFSRSIKKIGLERLPSFLSRTNALGGINVSIEKNKIKGAGNLIILSLF